METVLANVDMRRYRRLVQMIWDPEPSNDKGTDQPVWCLGRTYRLGSDDHRSLKGGNITTLGIQAEAASPSHNPPRVAPVERNTGRETPIAASETTTAHSPMKPEEGNSQESTWPLGFLDDFESRFWMTYRSEFDLIPKSDDPKATSALSLHMRIKSQIGDQSGFTSDSGWGCMIRSGQSLLANALGMLRLGREWRRGEKPLEERQIIQLFADSPEAHYSVHNFVRHGAAACGKYPGEWFGPSATARCIEALTNTHEPSLRVYSTGDGPDVYEDNFMRTAKPDGVTFHPTLILVGTRLGIDKITPVYWEALISALQMPQSVGIAGGRPSSSHYFVGSQGLYLFYLDPHHTRKALPYFHDATQYTNEEIDLCHTSRLRQIHVREMDPSMLIGFLIQSESDWREWRRCVKHVQGKAIIHVADQDPSREGGIEYRPSAIDDVETISDDDEVHSLT